MATSSERGLSFTRLYRDYGALVYATARAITGDLQLAEDASQETWIRIDRALRRGAVPRFPTGWVLTIARRESARVLRRRGHRSLVQEPAAPSLTGDPETRERAQALRRALAGLTEEERDLFVQRYLEGKKPARLCPLYGLTRSGLWKRLERIRKKLLRSLPGSSEAP